MGTAREEAALAKFGKDQIVTIHVLREKGESNSQIARRLEVSEGAVRYHLRRAQSGASDGRKKQGLIEQLQLEEAVLQWWLTQESELAESRPPSVRVLHAYLQEEHGYAGSYKSVRRYVRTHYPAPRKRPYRRVETPPGAQMQTDWFEVRGVDLGAEEGPETVYGLVIVLSYSRKEAVIWSRGMKQLDWHHCHNEGLKRLGGVAAVNRIDNLKTGISQGAGPWGTINPSYATYARSMGFHIDAHEPLRPEQKGKVERRAGVTRPERGTELGGGESISSRASGLAARALRSGEDLSGLQRLYDTLRRPNVRGAVCVHGGAS